MNITLQQWQEIDAKHRIAKQALNDLEHALRMTALDHVQQDKGITPETSLLLDFAGYAEDALCQILRFDPHPQSEWMGGNSRLARNFKIREPNCVPMPRGYLSEEEPCPPNTTTSK